MKVRGRHDLEVYVAFLCLAVRDRMACAEGAPAGGRGDVYPDRGGADRKHINAVRAGGRSGPASRKRRPRESRLGGGARVVVASVLRGVGGRHLRRALAHEGRGRAVGGETVWAEDVFRIEFSCRGLESCRPSLMGVEEGEVVRCLRLAVQCAGNRAKLAP